MRWNLAVAALASSWGFVSILVREIELDAEVLVFYRCMFAIAALALGLVAASRLDLLTRPSNRSRSGRRSASIGSSSSRRSSSRRSSWPF